MSHDGTINHDQVQPNTKASILFLVLSIIIVGLILVGSLFYYLGTRSMELDKKQIGSMPIELKRLRAYESEELNSFKWVDKKNGTIQIPIDMAIEKTVQDYQSK